jgi:hypothetical protein
MTDDPKQAFVEYVLTCLRRAPLAARLPVGKLAALAWSLAVEVQAAMHAQASDVDDETRDAYAHARHVMRFQSRAMLANLGLLPMRQVEQPPLDADGWDIQVGELFALDRADLLARCRAMEAADVAVIDLELPGWPAVVRAAVIDLADARRAAGAAPKFWHALARALGAYPALQPWRFVVTAADAWQPADVIAAHVEAAFLTNRMTRLYRELQITPDIPWGMVPASLLVLARAIRGAARGMDLPPDMTRQADPT